NERCGIGAGNGRGRSQRELVNGHLLEGANRDGFLSGLIPRGGHAEEVAPWQYGVQDELSIRIRGSLRNQRPGGEEPYRRIRNRRPRVLPPDRRADPMDPSVRSCRPREW